MSIKKDEPSDYQKDYLIVYMCKCGGCVSEGDLLSKGIEATRRQRGKDSADVFIHSLRQKKWKIVRVYSAGR